MNRFERWMACYGDLLPNHSKAELVEIVGNAEARGAKYVLGAKPDLLNACEAFLEAYTVDAEAIDRGELDRARKKALEAVKEARGQSSTASLARGTASSNVLHAKMHPGKSGHSRP